MPDPIVFIATVYKVSTLVDGGLRVTLDLPESAILEVARLMECKRTETALRITVIPYDSPTENSR